MNCKNCKRKLPNKNFIRNNKCIWCNTEQGEEMNKPKKKILENNLLDTIEENIRNKYRNQGYYNCYEEWEKFLPNEEELKSIIYCTTQYLPIPDKEVAILNSRLYKKISERLGE